MNTSLVVVLLASCAVAAFAQLPRFIPVVSRVAEHDPSGEFRSSYQSGDGTVVQEVGSLRRTNDGRDNVVVKQGSYRYTSPEGTPVSISYTADEYGFRPNGNPLPAPAVELSPVF